MFRGTAHEFVRSLFADEIRLLATHFSWSIKDKHFWETQVGMLTSSSTRTTECSVHETIATLRPSSRNNLFEGSGNNASSGHS